MNWKLGGAARALVPVVATLVLVAGLYPMLSAAGTDAFEYDELGRLKKVTYANGTSTTYTLDAAGNRTALSTSSSGPTYINITASNGTILPAAASLYAVASNCNSSPGGPVCTWVVRKLYGNQSTVIAVAHGPGGVAPACNAGVTQQITTGYVRAACELSALSTVYGQ